MCPSRESAAAETHCGHRVKRFAGMVERRLEAEANSTMPAIIGKWPVAHLPRVRF